MAPATPRPYGDCAPAVPEHLPREESAAFPTVLTVLTVLQTLRHLDTSPHGLTEADVEARLLRYGPNVLPAHRPVTRVRRFLRSLRDPFTAVLLTLGGVSALVASWGTAGVILVLVAISCVLRSSGEHRADRSMAALRELVADTATVVRQEGTLDVPVGQLVPGDIVRLGPGDLVPADVRLLRARGLTVHQAALTGEAAPADKYPADRVIESAFDSPSFCFQGSSVATGTATAVVVATGSRTRFAASYSHTPVREASAFDRSVSGISWILVRFMLLTPPLVLMTGAALRGRGIETLPFAVAVAVGMTPEMLPVIVTTCLARGAALLARTHGVIVKRLPALHDLGAVDVLCLDKTGTLTEDRPVVDRAFDADGREDPAVLHWAAVNAWWTLQLSELPVPDALDEALLDAVPEDRLFGDGHGEYDGIAALPFDPVRRLSTAVVRVPGAPLGTHTLVVKGAVENVLERCALDEDARARLLALADSHAADGARLLAVATTQRPVRAREFTAADERGLEFRGFVALRDALVPSAAEALAQLAERGVAVKILTGDHPGTAARTCRDLGLDVKDDDVRTAADLDHHPDLGQLALRTTVFARCTPTHKARIVAALRGAGHTVGFLGDGVNDLPALRTADVGIAPRDASDVAREGADVVLAEDERDLTAIGYAVAAGRRSSGNIAAYLRVTLSSNLGNVIAMLAAGIVLPFLPMLPAQVLAQNLCFDAAQLSFAHDRPAPAELARPTVLRPRELLRFIVGFGVLNAVADLATFAVLALAVHNTVGAEEQALFHSGWFTENLLTQALVMLLLRGRVRRVPGRVRPRVRGTARRTGPIGWAAVGLAVAGLLLPLSPAAGPLGLTALPGRYYLLLAVVLALYAAGLAPARARYQRRIDAGADTDADVDVDVDRSHTFGGGD
ncbi:magnesium-translocating P-type ATPase [Actinobacteria bacterium OK074]|nr:magnesium-translocating P-type ATPase [Actinobacteria bacterium OK074]